MSKNVKNAKAECVVYHLYQFRNVTWDYLNAQLDSLYNLYGGLQHDNAIENVDGTYNLDVRVHISYVPLALRMKAHEASKGTIKDPNTIRMLALQRQETRTKEIIDDETIPNAKKLKYLREMYWDQND